MGIYSGLDAIREKVESRPQAGGDRVNDRELTRNLKPNKPRNIRFAQELEPESEHYREDLGTALVVSEYEHPELFWLRLVDTYDEEGAAWPSEQGWASKLTLYINVVDVDTGEVFFLNRSILGGLGAQILESATTRGSLTDSKWSIKKKGEGMNTSYTLTLTDLVTDPVEVDPEDLIDFRKQVLREVPYAEQEKHVREVEGRVRAKKDEAAAEAPATGGSGDEDDVW